MEAETARAIITQARKDETYNGPIPEDDAGCIKAAEELIAMAQQAWDQYIRGPEVEAILNLAKNGGSPEAEQEAPPPETQADQPQVTHFEPSEDASEEEEAPEQDLEGVDPQLLKIEPWEGYNEDRVKDITEGINVALEAEDDPAELLAHVWAYESAHKRRVRILKHLKEAWERVGGKTDEDQTTEPQSEPSAAEEPRAEVPSESEQEEPVADAPHAPEPEHEVVGQNEELQRPAAGEGEPSDAHSQPAGKAAQASTEDRPRADEAEPPSKDRAYAALIQGVDRQLHNERLDMPKPPEERLPELPWRWADIPDGDLHDFHMQFAALAYYKSYQLSREERIGLHCKEAAEELSSKLLLKIDKYDEKGKQKSVTLLEAEVIQDPNVRKWRQLQHKHEQFAAQARREMDSYSKLVEALSRLETMRHQAWERGRR